MRHAAYTAYFRQLASEHTDIRHGKDEMHFARIIRSNDPFAKLELGEFLNSLKNSLKPPFMLLETYEAGFTDNRSDNKRKTFFGGFIILDKPAKGDYQDIEAKLDLTEQIAEELIARVYEDYRHRRLSWEFDLNEVNTEKVGPIADGYYGTRVDFQFTVAANKALLYNPDKFLTT